MEKNKLAVFLFEIAGLLWIVTAFAGKDWMFIPIGFCFVTLGIVYARDNEGE